MAAKHFIYTALHRALCADLRAANVVRIFSLPSYLISLTAHDRARGYKSASVWYGMSGIWLCLYAMLSCFLFSYFHLLPFLIHHSSTTLG